MRRSSGPPPKRRTSRALAWQVACHPSLLACARRQMLRLSSWDKTARQTSPSSRSMPHRSTCDLYCRRETLPDRFITLRSPS